MPAGWSLVNQAGRWREEPLAQASLTESGLEVELHRDGDTVTVAARSENGTDYRGDYRYREGSESNGEVRLSRYRNDTGNVLVGTWKESDKVSGSWIIVLTEGKSQK